jgi:deoxycytidylate deaminase
MNIIKNIDILKTIAEDSSYFAGAKLAAGIFYKNRLIAIGTNQEKTHPFAVEYAKNEEAIYLHAETAAILKAKKKLSDKELSKSTLIVIRLKSTPDRKNILFGLAKPCSGCTKCISDHGIRKVIYTNNCEPDVLSYTITERNH